MGRLVPPHALFHSLNGSVKSAWNSIIQTMAVSKLPAKTERLNNSKSHTTNRNVCLRWIRQDYVREMCYILVGILKNLPSLYGWCQVKLHSHNQSISSLSQTRLSVFYRHCIFIIFSLPNVLLSSNAGHRRRFNDTVSAPQIWIPQPFAIQCSGDAGGDKSHVWLPSLGDLENCPSGAYLISWSLFRDFIMDCNSKLLNNNTNKKTFLIILCKIIGANFYCFCHTLAYVYVTI